MASRQAIRRLGLLARLSRYGGVSEVTAFAVPVAARGLSSMASQLNARVVAAPRRVVNLVAVLTRMDRRAETKPFVELTPTASASDSTCSHYSRRQWATPFGLQQLRHFAGGACACPLTS